MNNYSEYDLINTLSELHLTYRNRNDELLLDRCPFCENDRPNKSDHFSFNKIEGVYNCVKCNSKGNLYTFRREMNIDPFQNKKIVLPDQSRVSKYREQQPTYYKAYEKSRGIPEAILLKYGVGKTEYGTLGLCRTYQYIDTDGTIANVKYVNAKKEMAQEKDSKKIYYGLQFINFDLDYLYVCEGEDDCHALVSMGIDNVVSIPNGANSYTEEMGKINNKFKKIYLLYDNDKAGQDGAYNFAQKAGVWKCWNVILPFKDARDCLLHGIDIFTIQQYINKATQFEYSPDSKERPALSLSERLDRYEREAEINEMGIKFGYKIIDDVTGGLRGGDLLSIVANPGCFKTTTLMNLLKSAAERNDNGIVIFFSLEMQIEAEIERELQMYSDIPAYKMRQPAAKKSAEWIELREGLERQYVNRIYVSEENDLDIDGIIKVIKRTEEMTGENSILIGIDYIDFIKSKSQKEYDAVKEIMNGIKKYIARKLNVPVIILCQTNRESKDSESEVGERSGKGGTGIESASDFMIGIWKNGDRVIGKFTKHRRLVYADTPNPYLSFNINKKTFRINDISECVKPIKEKECGAF